MEEQASNGRRVLEFSERRANPLTERLNDHIAMGSLVPDDKYNYGVSYISTNNKTQCMFVMSNLLLEQSTLRNFN